MSRRILFGLILSALFVVPAGAQVPTRDIYVTNCPYASPPGGSIQKITPAGIATTVATGIGICVGSLIFDNLGNMMFVGMENFNSGSDPNVYQVSPSGIVSVFVTGPPLVNPVRLAKDASGNLIVADEGNPYGSPAVPGAIRKVTPSGTISTIASGSPLVQPFGIDIDRFGNYIVADASGNTIFRITPAGVVTTVASGGLVNFPSDVKVDSNGDYIVACGGSNSVIKVTPAGTVSSIISPIPNAVFLVCLAIDANNNYLVGDASRPAIYVVSPSGSSSVFLVGSPLSAPTFIAMKPLPAAVSAPSVNEWGMIILALGLLVGGMYYLRKDRLIGNP